MRRYGRYGNPEDPKRCVVEVAERPHYIQRSQCSRKRGHGKDGLYCKQHAKQHAKEEE